MSVNGKFDGFLRGDLLTLADTVSISKSTVVRIISAVGAAVRRREEFAQRATVPEEYIRHIAEHHRLPICDPA